MNIHKTITMLIVGLAIMGFTSTSMAFTTIGGDGNFTFGGFEGHGGFEKEETMPEAPEEEEIVAEAESEAPPTEEEEYTEEERVVPVAGEGEEEIEVPEIY